MDDRTSSDIEFTGRLDEIIHANLENEKFGVKDLARAVGMSRFNLNRKLHSLTGTTINQYIRRVRLQRAMEILQQGSLTASEVAFRVGFSSAAYFSTCFSLYFGFPPGEAKKRGPRRESSNDLPAPAPMPPVTGKRPGKWAVPVISILIILLLVLVLVFSNRGPGKFGLFSHNRLQDKKPSIAVLPFINDSKDPENLYFINGVMEAILDNLSKIKDLEVRPRTSVEKYRNIETKTIPEIARELGVNYIIEGSGQKIGDNVSLYIQLIEAGSDKHIFSQRYNMKLEDIFALQSEVAIKVASEIKAIITTEEKELITKTPTTNFTALNLFLQANDLHNMAESDGNWELDVKAERLYRRAIQLDPAYAAPYSSLGWIVFNRDIDSALLLADAALGIDPENAEAYTLKGQVYWYKGAEKEAEAAYKQSIKYNPNNSPAYRKLGELYFYQGDCYSAIESHLQAFRLENNSAQEKKNLESFCSSLYSLGFYAEGEQYAKKLLELDNDSSYYFWSLASVDLDRGDFRKALGWALKMYECDPEDPENIYLLFHTYLYLRDFTQAYRLMQKYQEVMKRQGKATGPDYLFGFACLETGRLAEADFHFEGTIKEINKIIMQDQPSSNCWAFLVLTKIHAARNEKAKAIGALEKAKVCMGRTIMRLKDYKNCTMFDNIRSEPEFEEYLQAAESRYLVEHKKVRKLLLDEGILSDRAQN